MVLTCHSNLLPHELTPTWGARPTSHGRRKRRLGTSRGAGGACPAGPRQRAASRVVWGARPAGPGCIAGGPCRPWVARRRPRCLGCSPRWPWAPATPSEDPTPASLGPRPRRQRIPPSPALGPCHPTRGVQPSSSRRAGASHLARASSPSAPVSSEDGEGRS